MKKRVRTQGVARVPGGEAGGVRMDVRSGPVSLFALQRFLVDRLHSTGGRPRLRGTGKRRSKVAFFEEDWEKLEAIARYYREKEGVKVARGQIASALVHVLLSRMRLSR